MITVAAYPGLITAYAHSLYLGDHRPSILGLTWPDLAADLGTTRLQPLPGLPVLGEELLAPRDD